MTEQPTTPREPVRPMPRLGRGLHWSDVVAEIERDHLARTRAAEPTPKAEKSNSQPGSNLEQLGVGEVPRALATGGTIRPAGRTDSDVIPLVPTGCLHRHAPLTPPPAAELRAIADDLNTHGGLDETFVAGLLRQAADPYADAKRQLGIVDPPPVTTTKPSPSFTDMIAKACDDALRIPPPAPIVVHPDDYEMFKDLLTPRPTPVTYDEIVSLFARLSQPLPFDTVKLTQAQIDAFPATRHAVPSAEPWHFFGTPVEIVETVEESTPYQLANAQPDGIVEIRGDLTEAELERLRGEWLRAVDAKPVLSRWRPIDPVAELRPAGTQWELGKLPEESGPQPVLTVVDNRPAQDDRPWWRRALDRVRRWGR